MLIQKCVLIFKKVSIPITNKSNPSFLQILVLVVSHDGIAQLVVEDQALNMTKEAMDWMKGYQEHLKGTGITELAC